MVGKMEDALLLWLLGGLLIQRLLWVCLARVVFKLEVRCDIAWVALQIDEEIRLLEFELVRHLLGNLSVGNLVLLKEE
jgi:hypothetical protein